MMRMKVEAFEFWSCSIMLLSGALWPAEQQGESDAGSGNK